MWSSVLQSTAVYTLMNFHVSRRYSDLISRDIISRGCRERRTRGTARRKGGRGFDGDEKRGRTICEGGGGEGGGGGRARFILLNVKFHVGTQL